MNVHSTPSRRMARPGEDEAFLRGEGRFSSDVTIAGQSIAHFVRSTHAAAEILSVSVADARKAPGVIAVLTGPDIAALGGGNITEHPPMKSRDGSALVLPVRPALAIGRVTHVGETIVMIVAETAQQAQDAADLVTVEYRENEAVTDLRAALAEGAPQVWPQAHGNLALDWAGLAADPEANARDIDAVIKSAPHVATLTLNHQRLVCNSMETRAATASYDAKAGTYHLSASSQGARTLRDAIAGVMGIAKTDLTVTTEHVGGAFGFKVGVYPEYVAALIAAKLVGRPVKWVSKRGEAFLSDTQGRDSFTQGELALDVNGKFLALRLRHTANLGAHVATVAAKAQTENFARCLPVCYDIKAIDFQAACVFSNTVPTAPYRGAGRPEANYIVERLVDEAARISGIDRVALRRMNMISPASMPYRTAVGTTYDTGEFEAVLDKALALARYVQFATRREEALKRGKYRGIGICCALEHAGATPVEGVWLEFDAAGRIELRSSVHSTGQGHASVFSRLLGEKLGLAADQITYRQGDSRFEITGYSAVGSRSAMHLTHAMDVASRQLIEKGMVVAASILECAESDVVYAGGAFAVAGTDRKVLLKDVALAARRLRSEGKTDFDLGTKLATETGLTFPNGCHIAEVEVDPKTGYVTLIAYSCVDDCGTVLDRTVVEGQTHGSIVQGLGQALYEQAVYDDRGQLITGSFLDYTMPRAEHIPEMAVELHPVPATTNPHGVKGAGEAGTVAAIAAVMNALADALPDGRGRTLDMPATPENVWRACADIQTRN